MSINQTITIQSTAEKIYGALMSGEQFGEATGASAEISQAEGGEFSCFDGQILGRQLQLIPNKRIVQAWRAGAWPEGTFSIVNLDITGSDSSATITLEQTGYPEDAAEHLDGGWHKMYWEPLRAFLE